MVRAREAPSLVLPVLAVECAEVGVVASAPLVGTTPLGGFALGGTSWTCKFSGWLDFDGGGRTKIKVYIGRNRVRLAYCIVFEREHGSGHLVQAE